MAHQNLCVRVIAMSIFEHFFTAVGGKQSRKHQISKLIEHLTENEAEDRRKLPKDGERWQPFLPILHKALEQYGDSETGTPVDASIQIFITEDQMYAYACLLPPLDGGEDVPLYVLGQELQRRGLSDRLEDAALSFLIQKQYLHIFSVAQGIPPEDGVDGKVEELFSHKPVYTIDVRKGEKADFQELRPVQLIQRGEAVFRIRPATRGKEGVDLMGRKLPCRDGIPVRIPTGLNLELSEDGLRVEATENGAVFDKDGSLYVQTAIVRPSTLIRDDKLVWLTYIDGDIAEGVRVTSTSSILVMGEMRGAEVVCKGSVRAQGGIRKGSKIDARGQVLAPIIENSQITAERDIFAEEIIDSDVTCGGNIFVTGGKGLIRGGTVRAVAGIECVQVGSPEGGRNAFILGYSLNLDEEIRHLSGELEEVQTILDKLRKNILNLRKGGELLSPERRRAVHQLVEQKELYEIRLEELNVQLHEAQDKRHSDRKKQLLFQKLYPVTAVKIGKYESEFTKEKSRGYIHLDSGRVLCMAAPR